MKSKISINSIGNKGNNKSIRYFKEEKITSEWGMRVNNYLTSSQEWKGNESGERQEEG